MCASRRFGQAIFLFISILGLLGFSLPQIYSLEGSFSSPYIRYVKNEPFQGEIRRQWSQIVWKGERTSTQLLLWNKGEVASLRYAISDLQDAAGHHIGAAALRLRTGIYAKGDPRPEPCGVYTDPRQGDISVEIVDGLFDVLPQSIDGIASSDPLKLWLTVDVPRTAPAGRYSGAVSVRTATDVLRFAVQLEVVDYTLPPVADWKFHLDLWQFPYNLIERYNEANPGKPIALWSEPHFALLKQAYVMLADAGQKVITAHIKDGALGDPAMIKWIRSQDGYWEYDFSVFDKYVQFMISLGIDKQISAYSPVGWNESEIPYYRKGDLSRPHILGAPHTLDAPLDSETYKQAWSSFLYSFKQHLKQKQWFDKTVLYLDEVKEELLLSVIKLIKAEDKDWKVGLTYSKPPIAQKINRLLYDSSGVLAYLYSPAGKLLVPPVRGRKGKITTFYTSCSPNIPNNFLTPLNNLAELRWMPWHSLQAGFDGYLRWAYDNWPDPDSFNMRNGGKTAGDFSFIYRSGDTPPVRFFSSIRFALLREGIQDYEKVHILRQALQTDKQSLARLNTLVAKFRADSGVAAEYLIPQADALLQQLSQETARLNKR